MRVARSENIDGLIFDRRGDGEPDRRLSGVPDSAAGNERAR